MLLQFLAALESGEKTPGDLWNLCLRRVSEMDGGIRAWAAIASETVPSPGPLHGIPYGAKDIIETCGIPTEYGSAVYRGRIGTVDAAIVSMLRARGAVLLGKTHTTAFASFDPAPTRNPRHPGCTPGGSSSGSAAAVAAGMVPFAVGTQTLGSVIRPASYCGICGLRSAAIPMDGILPFAPTLDTGGFFTETAMDMQALWIRTIGSPSTATLDRAADFGAPSAIVDCLRGAGVAIDRASPPEGWERLTESARLINDFEGARTHRARYLEFGEALGTRLAHLIRCGLEIPSSAYEDALHHAARMRARMASVFDLYPVVLSSAATGPPPPAILNTTGDPSLNAPWSALLGPVIAVPVPGQPAGLQMAARPGDEDALIALAVHAERLLRGAC